MKHIRFRYQDEFTNGEWAYQECCVMSLEECIEIYGLREVKYQILSIEEV